MRLLRSSAICVLTLAPVLLLATTGANATDGYFQHGFGARQKALGGAGVADGRDATTTSLNPAGLVHSGNEVSAAVSWFNPHRGFDASGSVGSIDSLQEDFFVPNFAASYRLLPGSIVDVVGVTVYGNGGLNTNYAGNFLGGTGKSGVDLQQALVSFGAAKQFGTLSVGLAPTLLRQRFKARGLQAFGIDPNPSNDVAWGAGLRGGVEWQVAPAIRLAVAGSSKIYSQEFEGYEGLFAERGDFDIPANLQAGIAVDITPRLTALVDYKRIWYGGIASVSNPSTNPFPLGSSNGPGFGWQDIDIIKAGLEWRATDDLTLRAGYSYATSALQSRDVFFNILAPAAVQHHITGGLEYAVNERWSVELAGLYAPEGSISGLSPLGPTELRMHQYDVTVGVKYKFDQPSEPSPLK